MMCPVCEGTLTPIEPPWLRCDGPRRHIIRPFTPEEIEAMDGTGHEPV